jgi:hypothetical protein
MTRQNESPAVILDEILAVLPADETWLRRLDALRHFRNTVEDHVRLECEGCRTAWCDWCPSLELRMALGLQAVRTRDEVKGGKHACPDPSER